MADLDDMEFVDRASAGRLLAEHLADLVDQDVVVLALPRGGVPVAGKVASRLGADLDVLLVKKIGAPGQEELALAAVGGDGRLVVNRDVADAFRIEPAALRAHATAVASRLADWGDELRQGAPVQPIEDRIAVVVDDGIATGASMRAALEIVRSRHPAQIVAAVPVAPTEACAAMETVADRVECLRQPIDFGSVGRWFRDFTQLNDDDVRQLLTTVRQ